jgi:hypothetical protein
MKKNQQPRRPLYGCVTWIIWMGFVAAILSLSSCATYKCYPSKRSRDYAHYHVKPHRGGSMVTIRGRYDSRVVWIDCHPDTVMNKLKLGYTL